MTTFITSDTHFGHENIIKYCNRPFANKDEMDEEMVRRWNSVVGKNDLVWHLGDFCVGNEPTIKRYLARLNGKVVLVMGNHDRLTQRKYLNIGFHKVYDKPVVTFENCIISHRPLPFVGKDCPFINLYGHIHANPSYPTFGPNSACVCVERTDYRPVEIWSVINQFYDDRPTTLCSKQ